MGTTAICGEYGYIAFVDYNGGGYCINIVNSNDCNYLQEIELGEKAVAEKWADRYLRQTCENHIEPPPVDQSLIQAQQSGYSTTVSEVSEPSFEPIVGTAAQAVTEIN